MFQVVSPVASTSAHKLRPASHHVHLSGHTASSSSRGDAHADIELDDDDDDDDDSHDYSSNTKLATPGQNLGSLATYMRGHGTHLVPSSSSSQPSQIASSLTGRIILTNRLLSLQPFFTRYTPETGDLVLGQVLSVLPGARRWKIDIASSSNSNLQLSAINLPGGIQRRKLASDELQMRTFFKEGDLLVAEVQGVYNDGSTSLHTRSLRYGKLRNGRLVVVPCRLVRRGKSHFVKLQQKASQVDMILGLNGWIWLSAVGAMQASGAGGAGGNNDAAAAQGSGRDIDAGATYSDALNLPPHSTLKTLSTLSSLLQLLAQAYLPISDQSVQAAWDVWTDVAEGDGDGDGGDTAPPPPHVLLPLIKDELISRGILTQKASDAAAAAAAAGGASGADAMEWDD